MSTDTFEFKPYQHYHYEDCLALFDNNCPDFFTPNEREDFAEFLRQVPQGYLVCPNIQSHKLRGAFGLIQERNHPDAKAHPSRWRLNWILIHPDWQGQGLGKAMMQHVLHLARVQHAEVIDITASQHSQDFFAHFGAEVFQITQNGWGPGMHRVDMVLPVPVS